MAVVTRFRRPRVRRGRHSHVARSRRPAYPIGHDRQRPRLAEHRRRQRLPRSLRHRSRIDRRRHRELPVRLLERFRLRAPCASATASPAAASAIRPSARPPRTRPARPTPSRPRQLRRRAPEHVPGLVHDRQRQARRATSRASTSQSAPTAATARAWACLRLIDSPGGIDGELERLPRRRSRHSRSHPVTTLDSSVPHRVTIKLEFFDGPSNDVVTLKIDGVDVTPPEGLTSWEDYSRQVPAKSADGRLDCFSARRSTPEPD